MPGWYIHMEAARLLVERLRAGDVPVGTSLTPAQAQQLGETAHEWRNYLALGAIGPDLFFCLPDFQKPLKNPLVNMIEWGLDQWEYIDETYIGPFEKWMGPVSENSGDILNNVTGGTLGEIGVALQELGAAIKDAYLDLLVRMADVWGFFGSGVPEGVGETAFYWSDQFHYRKTYEFARQLFADATTPQQQAFAIGWMSHCAADVTGHGFVNEKCGGPWRLHWTRHHLIENFIDSHAYVTRHGNEPYGEYQTSALHFWLAFRHRNDTPYFGADDAPAYDYFGAFPDYVNHPDPDFFRQNLWDLDTGDLPDDLCDLIVETMKKVYGNDDGANPPIAHVPRLLTPAASQLRDGTSGRPSNFAIQEAFSILYHFLKFATTRGYTPRRPPPPEVFDPSIFDPPRFPGSDGGVSDDPTRGDDPGDPHKTSWVDIVLAVFAFAEWLIQLGVWLATLPLAIVAQILLYPAREILYQFAVLPLWHAYMVCRMPLVLAGFLHPLPEELTPGLTELGQGTDAILVTLSLALQTPSGFPPPAITIDEPSGKNPGAARGRDPAYPRAVVTDNRLTVSLMLGFTSITLCNRDERPSEFLTPWRYPSSNHAFGVNGWEPRTTHPGPFLVGADGNILLDGSPGTKAARDAFEAAKDENETAAACQAHFPSGNHMGDPVDYGLYLVGKLTDSASSIPDFNLDADRGYGYHCWDWTRKLGAAFERRTAQFTFPEACTVPEQYCEPNGTTYDPTIHLSVYYLDQPVQTCDPNDPNYHPTHVTQTEIDAAGGIPPAGWRGI